MLRIGNAFKRLPLNFFSHRYPQLTPFFCTHKLHTGSHSVKTKPKSRAAGFLKRSIVGVTTDAILLRDTCDQLFFSLVLLTKTKKKQTKLDHNTPSCDKPIECNTDEMPLFGVSYLTRYVLFICEVFFFSLLLLLRLQILQLFPIKLIGKCVTGESIQWACYMPYIAIYV